MFYWTSLCIESNQIEASEAGVLSAIRGKVQTIELRSCDCHEPRERNAERESDSNFRRKARVDLSASLIALGFWVQRSASAKSAPGADDWLGSRPRQFEPRGGVSDGAEVDSPHGSWTDGRVEALGGEGRHGPRPNHQRFGPDNDAIFERLETDVQFRAIATAIVQKYGYLVPRVNPESELGKQQELLVQERTKWLAQHQEEERAAAHQKNLQNNLQTTRACDSADWTGTARTHSRIRLLIMKDRRDGRARQCSRLTEYS